MMMEAMTGKWGCSGDEEIYHGCFDTEEQAMAEARELGYRVIGQYREPVPPETLLNWDAILEITWGDDDYSGEWAEDWPHATEEQETELVDSLRKVFAEWLDKHNLRPTWGMVDEKTIQDVEEREEITDGMG
jgi:hypothetical protein